MTDELRDILRRILLRAAPLPGDTEEDLRGDLARIRKLAERAFSLTSETAEGMEE